MLTRLSFFEDTVAPSLSEQISKRISCRPRVVAGFALLNEPCVFEGARGVKHHQNAVLVAQLVRVAKIGQGKRLTACHVDIGLHGDVRDLARPTFSITARSLTRSTLPLKGCVLAGSCASSMMTSTNDPPAYSWWNRVVVKYMFPGITSPGLMRIWLKMCSAPAPDAWGSALGSRTHRPPRPRDGSSSGFPHTPHRPASCPPTGCLT